MSIEIAGLREKREFPYEGLVRWPLAGWLVLLLAFVLVWAGGTELPALAPFTSSLLVVGVVTLVFLAMSQFVLIPVGILHLANASSSRSPKAILAIICGAAHLVIAVFALWAASSAYTIHAA